MGIGTDIVYMPRQSGTGGSRGDLRVPGQGKPYVILDRRLFVPTLTLLCLVCMSILVPSSTWPDAPKHQPQR